MQIPAGLSLRDQQQFDPAAAPARTAHPCAPVLITFACEDKVSARKLGRKAVAVDDLQSACRGNEVE